MSLKSNNTIVLLWAFTYWKNCHIILFSFTRNVPRWTIWTKSRWNHFVNAALHNGRVSYLLSIFSLWSDVIILSRLIFPCTDRSDFFIVGLFYALFCFDLWSVAMKHWPKKSMKLTIKSKPLIEGWKIWVSF